MEVKSSAIITFRLSIFALLILLLLLGPDLTQAQTQTGVTVVGSQVIIAYEEPTDNQDGSPLTDLNQTKVWLDFIGDGQDAMIIKTTPATNLAGGGTISFEYTIPVLEEGVTELQFWATAEDLVGNSSEPSNTVTLGVEELDKIAPSPPKF